MESFRRSLNAACEAGSSNDGASPADAAVETKTDSVVTAGGPSSSAPVDGTPPLTPHDVLPATDTPEDAPAPEPAAHVARSEPTAEVAPSEPSAEVASSEPTSEVAPSHPSSAEVAPSDPSSADVAPSADVASPPPPVDASEARPGAETEISYGVEYLPPMRLVVSLPPDYPLKSPPKFTLWVLWLNPGQISRLCQQLDLLWEGQKGEVVLYAWTEWLRSESLRFLGLGNRIELGPYDALGSIGRGERDPRAVPEGMSLDEDLPWLLKYNEERKTEAFRRGIHTCYICFSEHPGKKFVRLPCGHNFCMECMSYHASMHVNEGTVHNLTCPDITCKKILSHNLLRELLDRETYERWEDIVLQKTLDTMADLVYCPRCKQACIEETDHHAQCSHCFFSFCSLCNDTWHHLNQPCTSAEDRLRILEERQRKSGGGKEPGVRSAADLEREEKVKELIRNEMLCVMYVRRQARQCPACKMAIEKTEGCNKMTCRNCGRHFCYKCGKTIKDYSHFSGSGACVLFEHRAIAVEEAGREQEEENIPDWDAEIDYARIDLEAAMAMWPERIRKCPGLRCGQQNLKKGNNNRIKCYFCKCTYCGLCGKGVKSPAAHFGPNGCSQQTDD